MNLGALLDELRATGIAVDGDAPAVFSVARELKILQFPEANAPVFLRILDRGKGERDFENLSFLGKRLGSLVNVPLSIVTTGELVCGVFPFLVHERVTHENVVSGKLLPQIGAALTAMHAAGREFAAEQRARPFAQLIESATGDDEIQAGFKGYFEAALAGILDRLTPVAQHCDFTYANLGITGENRIVIFDWEEYGAVTYPGFDFATFLLSHHHHAKTIGDLLKSPGGLLKRVESDFGDEFLSSLGLTAMEFCRLFPAYLYLFLKLKQPGSGFGAAINMRMRGMWAQLCKSESWVQTMTSMSG